MGAALGLAASGVSYALLIATSDFAIRVIAVLIWPTGVLLVANEGAKTSLEVAVNFAKAIGGNIALYAAVGGLPYRLKAMVRARRREVQQGR